MLWLGLGTAGVVLILLGCRLVIDFPGFLDWNSEDKFCKTSGDSDGQVEEVLITKERKMSKISSELEIEQCNSEISTKHYLKPSEFETINNGKPELNSMPRRFEQHHPKSAKKQSPVPESLNTQICIPDCVERQSCISRSADRKISENLGVSDTPVAGNITIHLNTSGDTVSIVIKKEHHEKDFNITIGFSDETKKNNTKIPGSAEGGVISTIVNGTHARIAGAVENDPTVECGLYQTKKTQNRQS